MSRVCRHKAAAVLRRLHSTASSLAVAVPTMPIYRCNLLVVVVVVVEEHRRLMAWMEEVMLQ